MPSQTAPSQASHLSLSANALRYLRNIRSPWKLLFYFLKNLPSAWWWGIRIKSVSPERAEVTLPFNWRTKNPFHSIYFAAMVGAGELSTGVLANLARFGKGNLSMLVLRQEAEFLKKASSAVTFSCEDGLKVQAAVQKAVESGEPQTVTMLSTGRNEKAEEVARVLITWTFKARN
jgi:hypothetical protein